MSHQENRISVPQAISELLDVVRRLQASYPNRRFTLDGRLVGDLGEVLAASAYEITLDEGMLKHHDATTADGRRVQIKATMHDSLTFPGDHIPDYYLGIKIHADGTFDEVFNGPGAIAGQCVKNRAVSKYNLHSISNNALKVLSAAVSLEERIPRKVARR